MLQGAAATMLLCEQQGHRECQGPGIAWRSGAIEIWGRAGLLARSGGKGAARGGTHDVGVLHVGAGQGLVQVPGYSQHKGAERARRRGAARWSRAGACAGARLLTTQGGRARTTSGCCTLEQGRGLCRCQVITTQGGRARTTLGCCTLEQGRGLCRCQVIHNTRGPSAHDVGVLHVGAGQGLVQVPGYSQHKGAERARRWGAARWSRGATRAARPRAPPARPRAAPP